MLPIINLTPHIVRIHGENKKVVAEFPSQGVARVATSETLAFEANDLPVSKVVYGETTGLPEDDANVYYIVSMIVAQANPDRKDLIAPNSAPQNVVRDDAGQIFSVSGFVTYAN